MENYGAKLSVEVESVKVEKNPSDKTILRVL